MKCDIRPLDLHVIRPFILSQGQVSRKRNYLIILEDIGLGEAAGSIHYGLDTEALAGELELLQRKLERVTLEQFPGFLNSLEGHVSGPSLCALSTAYHDLMARRNSQPLYRYLHLPGPPMRPTSVTVSVGDEEALRQFLRDGTSPLKIKMGGDPAGSNNILDLLRQAKGVRFRIDANGGWDRDEAMAVIHALPRERVELIEQPFPSEAIDDWAYLREKTTIPLFMDESIDTARDITRAARYIDGINIKIQKSGRLETAVMMMAAARQQCLKVMLGCMIESSVGIAAAYHLSALVDYIDLDGRLLVTEDLFTGLSYAGGNIQISRGVGHGVSLA